jgi:hypothetical protein
MAHEYKEKVWVTHSWQEGGKMDEKSIGYEIGYKGPKAGFDNMMNRGQAIMGSVINPALKASEDSKNKAIGHK